MNVLDTLIERGFVEQITDEEGLRSRLKSSQTVYIGFDPTADSLHLGSLIQILMLSHFQQNGHKVIALLGGATGIIGDPSGKSEERPFQEKEKIFSNLEKQREIIRRFLDFDGKQENRAAKFYNNLEWTEKISFLDWLREIGKHFTVNYMVAKESVRRRFEDREQGISYTEFSYMLLQAHDFLQLYKRENCLIQAGGSDQWGNITAGIDLIRRKEGIQAYGVTSVLLTASSGQKFGKTEKGAIWLDQEKTSIWDFYQFLVRSDDRDVIRFLKLLTFLPLEEINGIESEMRINPENRTAQKKLAFEVTRMVHGEEQARRMERGAESLYSGKLDELDADLIQQVFSEGPTAQVSGDRLREGINIIDLAVETGLLKSKGEARRQLKAGAIYINNQRLLEARSIDQNDLLPSGCVILRKGKKHYLVLQVH